MNYYIDQRIAETKQQDILRQLCRKQFTKTALVTKSPKSLFGRLASVFQFNTANICCCVTE